MTTAPAEGPAPIPGRAAAAGVLVLLAVSAAVSVAALDPPAARGPETPAGEFAAARALPHLRRLAERPHPVGSAEHRRVRQLIVDELTRLGLEVALHEAPAAGRFFGWIRSARPVNIVARLPGQGPERTPAPLLVAHYDSVAHSRGAGDDGAAVAALLETARALTTEPRRRDVLFLISDAEEEGLLGALAFERAHPWRHQVGAVLNFEARGVKGPSAMFEAAPGSAWLIDALGQVDPRPVATSFVTGLARLMPNDTDFTFLLRLGQPGLNFAFADGLHRYHTMQDSAAELDARSVEHHGQHALALARHLASLERWPAADPGARPTVYFDLLGRWLVRYPLAVAYLLALLAAAATVLGVRRAAREAGLGAGGLLRGAAVHLVAWVMATAAVVLAQSLLRDRLPFELQVAHARELAVGFQLVGLAVWLGLLALAGPRLRQGWTALGLGALLLLLPLGWLATIYFPGGSYLLVLPLLAVGLTLALAAPAWMVALAGLPIALLWGPAVYAIEVATGATVPAAPVLFTVLALSLASPALVAARRSGRELAALAACALVGGVITLALGARATFDARVPRKTSLLYALDTDSGEALWLTRERPAERWTQRLIRAAAPARLQPAFDPLGSLFFSAPAPVTPLSPARLALLEERRSQDAGMTVRHVKVRITSGGGRCLRVWERPGTRVVATLVEGLEVTVPVRFGRERDEELLRRLFGVKPRPWRLSHCGGGDRPLTLELTLEGDGPATLQLLEEHEGFPGGPEVPAVPPRPPELIPAAPSDASWVSRRFTF